MDDYVTRPIDAAALFQKLWTGAIARPVTDPGASGRCPNPAPNARRQTAQAYPNPF